MPYQVIITNYGLARIANAASSGTPVNLTQISVGDGNGAETTPLATQTSLVHEVYRGSINSITTDPLSATTRNIDMLVPLAVGGWTIREVGVWDDQGQLVAVGNFPATYKPTVGDGATNEMVIRIPLVVSSASIINVTINPSLISATQAWVLATITGALLIPGGTTGQVLTKTGNGDGAWAWQSPGAATYLVDMLYEIQTVSAVGQATFNLASRTTTGLAVFVEGAYKPFRTGAGGWQKGSPALTQVVLGDSYPVGTEIVFAQNVPAGALGTPLQAGNNLSDVASAATARSNLSVYSKAEVDLLQPSANVCYSARTTPPAGWLVANGAAVSRTAYAALFAAIGTTYGAGDGSTTFNLPDGRGEFIRGHDQGRGVDIGRVFGSLQLDAFQGHRHAYRYTSNITAPPGVHAIEDGNLTSDGSSAILDPITDGINGTPRIASETRPRNIALLPIIKY